ncbi:MAG: Ada metal-binding domain-containing protein [Planctomycetota bacterium]|jgi:hypothetical protein
MKTEKCFVIAGLVTAILCAAAGGEVESVSRERESVLIGPGERVLAGIRDLYVVVGSRVPGPYDWRELEAKVEGKVEEAGMKTGGAIYLEGKFKCLDLPELRVYIDAVKLEENEQCVFHIQTGLATKVFLEGESLWFRKAEVWQVRPVMQAVSAGDVRAEVERVVLEQVEAFINARAVANAQIPQFPDANDVTAVPKAQVQPAPERSAAKYRYVASKKSKVFHSSACRSAGRISPENVAGYNSREQALMAGKRPCKQCKP